MNALSSTATVTAVEAPYTIGYVFRTLVYTIICKTLPLSYYTVKKGKS